MSRRAVVVDSSAFAAILFGEADGDQLLERLMSAPQRYVSATSVLEASIVVERRLGVAGTAALDELLAALNAEIVPFDSVHIGWARRAFRKYGKSRHAAALNFGDCVAYATAKHLGLPLLFKGEDFPQTDIESA